MKKIIFIAAAALISIASFAQETVQQAKFAYVDFNEVMMLHPDMDAARAAIEENQKTNEEILMTMYQEYQTKMQQYEQKNATWTPAVREVKEKELMEIQQRLEQTQQSLSQELQQLQQQLQAPIYEKVQTAVDDLARQKGIAAVFEKSSLLYVDPTLLVDLTPEARVVLQIPADRTLEKLQQELQAKAQAAQAAQGN